ncbi:MAG: hypothetical protein WKF84_20125 [Pyrinomonadaceae bacterium]
MATVSTTIARARDFEKFKGWDAWLHLATPERKAAAFLHKQARDGVFLIEAEEKEGATTASLHATRIRPAFPA